MASLAIEYKKITDCETSSSSSVGDCAEKNVSAASLADTSYIFKGIYHNAGGLLQNAEYKFRVSAKAVTNGRWAIVKSAWFETRTLHPLTFTQTEAAYAFGAEIHAPKPFSRIQWNVSDVWNVRLGRSEFGSVQEFSKERYESKITVPRATGLQIWEDKPGKTPSCEWDTKKWPSATFGWGKWRSEFRIIRCAVGSKTSAITVRVRNTEHDNYEWEAIALPVKRAWHDANHHVDYQIGCMPPSTDKVDYAAAIRAGASAWNSSNSGFSFTERLPQNGCGDMNRSPGRVPVEIYNTGTDVDADGDCDSNPADNIKIAACVIPVDTDYPHLTSLRILINGEMKWQSVTNSRGWIDGDAFYLPWAVAHEFGHMAGLGHSGDSAHSRSVMAIPAPRGKVNNPLVAASDVSAMKSIYESHTAH